MVNIALHSAKFRTLASAWFDEAAIAFDEIRYYGMHIYACALER